MLAGVSGAHLNPAVTFAAWLLKRIDGVDAIVYVLAQLSGAVLGALLVKGLLLDEGMAANYGALDVSPLLAERLRRHDRRGARHLPAGARRTSRSRSTRRAWREWGAADDRHSRSASLVMIFGPLTGAGFNPARWFGPALISEECGGVWPYLVGPLLGAVLAVLFYKFVIEAGEPEGEPEKAPGT